MPVHLIVNGKAAQVTEPIRLSEFLAMRGLDPDSVVVEYNLAIIPKEDLGKTILKENDRLEILRFVGGG